MSTGGPEAGIPVELADGTVLGMANVVPSTGHLRLVRVELPLGFTITDSPAARMAELEAQLSRTIRERDRWAAKFGRLQAAALQLKVEASDSEEVGADAWDPETHDFRQEEPGG